MRDLSSWPHESTAPGCESVQPGVNSTDPICDFHYLLMESMIMDQMLVTRAYVDLRLQASAVC